MLKIQSIISSLQNFDVMYLSADNQEFICKDEDSNAYIICHSDIEEGVRYVSLSELKAFIKSNETLFTDKFSAQEKYQGSSKFEAPKNNEQKDADEEVQSKVVNYSLEELDNLCKNLRSSW